MKKTLLPIQAVARKLEIPEKYVEQIGAYGAKIRLELLADPAFKRRGKLILVTATTPTVSGEGKTVTAIGLTQGLALIGKKVVITSREPSLGPVFGMKGGAAGGAQGLRIFPPRMTRSQPQLATAYAPGSIFTWEGGKGA